MKEADAVFIGKVTKLITLRVQPDDPPEQVLGYEVMFEVKEWLKGEASIAKGGQTVKISTGGGWGDCGYEFTQDKEYLVYAHHHAGQLSTSICTRTHLLENAENELLELRGRLPKPPGQPQEPELALLGRIDDAGYKGYVFELRNRLHERIYFHIFRTQVWHKNAWVEYLPNFGQEAAEDPKWEEVPALMKELEADLLESGGGHPGAPEPQHLQRMYQTREIIAPQSETRRWRVGFQYVTEAEFDAGAKVAKSPRIAWGPPIDPGMSAPKITFADAFSGSGMIPYPLGSGADSAPKEPR